MNFPKLITGTCVAAVIVLMTATPVLPQQMHHGRGMGPMYGVEQYGMMFSQLTQEQQRTVRNIYQGYQQATAETMEKLWAQELQLQAALAADKIDESRVNSLVDAINDLRSNLYREQVNMYMQLAEADLMYPVMRSLGGMGRGGMGMGMTGSCPMMGSGMMGPWMMGPGPAD